MGRKNPGPTGEQLSFICIVPIHYKVISSHFTDINQFIVIQFKQISPVSKSIAQENQQLALNLLFDEIPHPVHAWCNSGKE